MDKDPLEKTDWVTLEDYLTKIAHAQGYENVEEFMGTKWARNLVSVYGEGKIRAYMARIIGKMRDVK
jgi:hypothetical protein